MPFFNIAERISRRCLSVLRLIIRSAVSQIESGNLNLSWAIKNSHDYILKFLIIISRLRDLITQSLFFRTLRLRLAADWKPDMK